MARAPVADAHSLWRGKEEKKCTRSAIRSEGREIQKVPGRKISSNAAEEGKMDKMGEKMKEWEAQGGEREEWRKMGQGDSEWERNEPRVCKRVARKICVRFE